ncbi:hypothetical protein HanIR_Chr11g0510031 [Helianthus annuus]|nr:hypothetical protein HanIR_Chr11g0510031 [Helianthus annuus]
MSQLSYGTHSPSLSFQGLKCQQVVSILLLHLQLKYISQKVRTSKVASLMTYSDIRLYQKSSTPCVITNFGYSIANMYYLCCHVWENNNSVHNGNNLIRQFIVKVDVGLLVKFHQAMADVSEAKD